MLRRTVKKCCRVFPAPQYGPSMPINNCVIQFIFMYQFGEDYLDK